MISSQSDFRVEGEEEFGSLSFKAFFLLQFTKELIQHLGAGEVFKLENILKEQTKEKGNRIKNIIKEKEKRPKKIEQQLEVQLKEKEKPLFKPLLKPRVIRRTFPSILRIPEPKLPPRLQYLRPTPAPTNIQIDLEKLNPLIKDSMVRDIQCNGPDKNIIVKGAMGVKGTNIILSKEEINQVIKKFSETAKIPLQEGIFRVVVGRLILSAIISDVIGSKFIIKKMMYSPAFRR